MTVSEAPRPAAKPARADNAGAQPDGLFGRMRGLFGGRDSPAEPTRRAPSTAELIGGPGILAVSNLRKSFGGRPVVSDASRYLRQHWKKGLVGGVGTMGSYGLALWAMTQAPLAVVAALRETAILFGAVIAFTLLKEKMVPLRIAAACGIAVGAMLLRLS